MAAAGRPRSCECGQCTTCRNRAAFARKWAKWSPERRREWLARKDRAKRRAAERRRQRVDGGRSRAYRARHPERVKARKAVANAIKRGLLVRGACERGPEGCAGPVQAHHEDYSKPLDVRWLCREHHYAEHREERAA